MNEMTLIRNRPNIGRVQASESAAPSIATIIMMKLALVLSTAICAVDASYKCVLDSEPFGWCGGDSWDGEWIAPDTAFSSAEDCLNLLRHLRCRSRPDRLLRLLDRQLRRLG